MHGASPLGRMLLRPNVSNSSSSNDEEKSHEHRFVPIKQNMNMERKKLMPRTESEAAVEILPSNDEFMQKMAEQLSVEKKIQKDIQTLLEATPPQ